MARCSRAPLPALLTLAVTVSLLALAPAARAAQAQPADAVVESIGVNTHLGYTDTEYDDFAMVRQRLGELGIRYIRDHVSLKRPDVYARMRTLAADGIRLNAIAGDPLHRWSIGTIDQQLDLIQSELPTSVVSIEGPNEYDLQGDPNWATVIRDYTKELWEGVQKRPQLASLPVIGPSIVRRSNMAKVGDLTPWIDYGNTHTYMSGAMPENDWSWSELDAKLAGVGRCSDAAIAIAKTRTGREELASLSCPAGSKVGNVWAGAGVGSQLTYVLGSVYLAGPFAGAPLSVVGVVPAVAGPFDVGTVVVRQALTPDPVTAEVRVDGGRSDAIPHMLAGIPLKVRDIRVNVDRPNFTLNPTSCNPFEVRAAIWGGGADPFSSGDDAPASRSARFQASDCASLAFKPRLALKLKGGTRRGTTHPCGRSSAHGAGMQISAGRRSRCRTPRSSPRSTSGRSAPGHSSPPTPAPRAPSTATPARSRRCSTNRCRGRPTYVRAATGCRIWSSPCGEVRHRSGRPHRFRQRRDQDHLRHRARRSGHQVRARHERRQQGLLVNSRNLCSGPVTRATVKMTAQNGRARNFAAPLQRKCGR